MTLDERIAFLQTQHRNNILSNLRLRSSAHHDMEQKMLRSDSESDIEYEQHIQNMINNGATPTRIRQLRRLRKQRILKSLGYVSHMFITQRRVIFYLCESESIASTIDQQLNRVLAANPSADLYSYEQELCFFITRIDEGQNNTDQIPIGEEY